MIVDKAKVAKQKYIDVGSLDTPNETFLFECLPLESNSNVILHTIDDVLRQLWTKHKKLFITIHLLLIIHCSIIHYSSYSLLLTDGWQNIKGIIPSSMHVTCFAHYYITALCEFVLTLKILMM